MSPLIARIAGSLAVTLFAGSCVGLPRSRTLPPLAAAAEARSGGEIVVGIARPGSIHPTLVSTSAGELISRLVCDTLIHLDPDTGAVVPGLAEEFVVSSDGLALTLKLRRGVRMHDGTEMTAQDVFFALHRLADPEEASVRARLLEGVIGFAQYSGRDLPAGKSRPARMAGVEILERYGIQLRLERGDPNLVRALAHPATAPFSRRAYELNPLAFARDPVCAGPYQVEGSAHPAADRIVLTRDRRHAAASPALTAGGAGYADRIVFRAHDDETTALRAYESGEVDVARVPAAAGRARDTDVVEGPHPSVEYVGLPATGLVRALGLTQGGGGRIDDLALRHALSLALDRTELASAIGDGARLPATGFVPPSATHVAARDAAPQRTRVTASDVASLDGLWRGAAQPPGLADDGVPLCRMLLPERGDAALAGRAIREATAAGPGRDAIPFYYNHELGNEAFVEAVSRQWATVLGLRIRPVPLSWERFLDRATEAGGFDGFYRLSFAAPALTPEAYLRPFAEPDGSPNLSRFSDDALTRMLAELRRLGGEDHLVELRQAEDLMCALMPVIPVTLARSRWLVRSRSLGTARVAVIGWDGSILLQELYVRP